MGLYDNIGKGLGLFADSGLAKLVSPEVQSVAETAAGLTRTATGGLQSPPQQGAPQGKPVVQANIKESGPVQSSVGGFIKANKGPLVIALVAVVGFVLLKRLL